MKKPILLLSLTLAAPAAAQMGGSATLAAPTDRREVVIANGFPWHCTGSTCSGSTSGDRFGDLRTCKDLAHQVGSVGAFVSKRGEISAEDMLKCNQRAKPAG